MPQWEGRGGGEGHHSSLHPLYILDAVSFSRVYHLYCLYVQLLGTLQMSLYASILKWAMFEHGDFIYCSIRRFPYVEFTSGEPNSVLNSSIGRV